jgi:histone H1/5
LKKYVKANNAHLKDVQDSMFDSLFNRALKNGVDKGVFEQPKGPSGGTKLAKPAAAAAKKDAPKKEADEKKPVAKKATTAKKPAAKKAAPKKEAAKKDDIKKAAPKKAAPKKATKAAAPKKADVRLS